MTRLEPVLRAFGKLCKILSGVLLFFVAYFCSPISCDDCACLHLRYGILFNSTDMSQSVVYGMLLVRGFVSSFYHHVFPQL